jgi:hypothetical protein
MRYLLFLLLLLAACTKDTFEDRTIQLAVEGNGNYFITYGISEQVTVSGTDKWTTTFNANPGDTIQLSVTTTETAATLYMTVEVKKGLLYCTSKYIEPQSVGVLDYIVNQ